MNPVLEKVGVQILVESVFIFYAGFSPEYFITEGDRGSEDELDFVFRGHVHIHDLVSVKAEFKLFMGVDRIFAFRLVRLAD